MYVLPVLTFPSVKVVVQYVDNSLINKIVFSMHDVCNGLCTVMVHILTILFVLVCSVYTRACMHILEQL